MAYLLLLGGLLVLVASGEALVRGAVGLALRFKISTLVVGMTVVSFGTSAPELLVSLQAALDGHADIALGNVVGSNITNLGLVLGLTAIIFPLAVARNTIRIDWPVMMLATVAFYIVIFDKTIGRIEGVLFVTALAVFSYLLIRNSRKEQKMMQQGGKEFTEEEEQTPVRKSILLVFIGCIGLAFGADWFVDGGVQIASNYGVSERVIGITLIAFGTSAPELVTSCMAAFRKEINISVGNLIGSNLFNILGVLGVTSIVKAIPVNNNILMTDIYWVLGITLLLFPLMFFDKTISRWDGLLLLGVYFGYMLFLFW
ncbi:MAG: hypothetical protein COA57_13200 [Flavobacteriales bacterium]|nr:MAG: hypothetical protein COA57_13200 [Flavobacteriales bacterium]